MTCNFCIRYEEKDEKIFTENEKAFAMWDQKPAKPGHALIISKEHIVSFFDCSNEILLDMFNLIRQVKQIIEKDHQPKGYTIGINEGKAAGRSIDHVHIHIIPRYNTDKGSGVRRAVYD